MWGGAGGVGTWAIQIAKQLGATVIATAGSERKLELMRQLGADHVINRNSEDVAARMQEIAPYGVDLALDFVGPATFSTTFDMIKKGGKILLCGILSGRETTVSLHMTYLRHISIRGLYLGTLKEMRALVNMVAEGKVKPLIGGVMELKDAWLAHKMMDTGDVIGKLILKV